MCEKCLDCNVFFLFFSLFQGYLQLLESQHRQIETLWEVSCGGFNAGMPPAHPMMNGGDPMWSSTVQPATSPIDMFEDQECRSYRELVPVKLEPVTPSACGVGCRLVNNADGSYITPKGRPHAMEMTPGRRRGHSVRKTLLFS